MKPLILRLAIAAVLAAGVIMPAQALDNQMKIDLQATLLSFLENASDDAGRFAVTDRSSGRLTRVYAGAMHPKIVPFGDDQILCIEMFTMQVANMMPILSCVGEAMGGWWSTFCSTSARC